MLSSFIKIKKRITSYSFFIILFFCLHANSFEFSQTHDNVFYTSQKIKPINDKPINISNCLIKSSKEFTLFRCEKYTVLMRNQEILKPFNESIRYFINSTISFEEISEDLALLVSQENLFYVFYQKNDSVFYYFFSLNLLFKSRIDSLNIFKYYGLIIISILYRSNGENDQNLLNFCLNPENYQYYKESKLSIKQPVRSHIQIRLNKITGNVEIILISFTNKLLIYVSESYEFDFKFKKQLDFFENIIDYKFSQNSDYFAFLLKNNGTRMLFIYKNNDYYQNFSMLCSIPLNSFQISDEEAMSFGFIDQINSGEKMKFNYVMVSFFERGKIYFYQIEEYFNTYGKAICHFFDKTFSLKGLNSKNQTIQHLGKYFSFISVKKTLIKPNIVYLSNEIQKITFQYIILGHEDHQNEDFFLIPFCGEKQEFIDFSCSQCLSYEYSLDFQTSCTSCKKTETFENIPRNLDFNSFKKTSCLMKLCESQSKNCLVCEQMMEIFGISKPLDSYWIFNDINTLGSPFPCEAQCKGEKLINNGICIDHKTYLNITDKCGAIKDCYNCSYVPFCFWNSDNFCREKEEQIALYQENSKGICPRRSFCQVHSSFSEGIVNMKFVQKIVLVEQNEWCLLQLNENGSQESEYSSFSIEVLENLIMSDDENLIDLEVCTYGKNENHLKSNKVFIDLKKTQKIGISTEKAWKIEIKITFLRNLLVDFSKIKISYESKRIESKTFRKHFILGGVLLLMTICFFFIVLKQIFIYIRRRYRLNFYNFLLGETLEKKIKRFIKNKFIKIINFVEGDIEYEQNECPFCLESFVKNEKLFQISCKHVFHLTCFKVWMNQNDENLKCPVCRRNLQTLDENMSLSSEINMEMRAVI